MLDPAIRKLNLDGLYVLMVLLSCNLLDLTIQELDLDYFFPMITSLTFMIISSPPA